ncbi:putative membrane-associated protein [Desulfitobacterium dichloroeliminans LMG P-21439]|uniref:Putative membrane-associated protein n=1 Tax=Desulfitobacterium dichloroeliminans (strain LMG P-21439 / DCA1) TaxID=871963 RepID=L0FA57_DESDL|nr:DedA family protein [Desulfitobacterium dichloroeliminans]AGA69521.1 putative membrane-associated protein [Desulfitobacterium dichloroeliminans LMG P-21439]
MLEGLLGQLGEFVVQLISSLGYFGVFLAMAIESACIPLPSEIILPFTGYMVYLGHFDFWTATLAATLGNLFGGVVAYYVGVRGGRPFIQRYGHYIFIKEKELKWTERLFSKHGEVTVLVGRMLPIIRTFISLPAGIAKMNPVKMAVYTVLGALPWCMFLIIVGEKLGANWNSLKPLFHRLDLLIGILLLFGIGYWLLMRIKHRR